MSLWTRLPVDVFSSVDASGNLRQPDLGQTTTLITEITRVVDSAVSGGNFLLYTTKAALDADLDHDANAAALVMGDSTSNDGIYVKSGASGAGSWTRVSDLPGYSFVKATDNGGSANAIAATTALPVNETQLIVLPIATTNTGSPVTVAFNGGSALTIKTSLNENVQVGALVAGSEMAGYVSGSTFQLITNPTTDTITDAATVEGVEPGLTGLAVLATETESAARDAVGLGTGDSPTFAGLTLNGELGATSSTILGDTWSHSRVDVASDTASPAFQAQRARGSQAAKTAIQSGDTIMAISPLGYNGASYVLGGGANWISTSDWSSTQSAFFRVAVINSGSWSEVMRILANGNAGIGTGNPTAKLQVVGDIRSSAEIRPGSYTTATLPAASGREGAVAYDSTLDRLTYSDNSAWNALAKLSEVVTRVATMTALKALDVQLHKAVYVQANDQIWYWENGDYSDEVSNDTGEVKYAKADSTATTSGAWVAGPPRIISLPAGAGEYQEIRKHSSPTSYLNSLAAKVIQVEQTDDQASGTWGSGLIVSVDVDADGGVTLGSPDSSQTVWHATRSSIVKTGDGSGACYGGAGTLSTVGATGYNELGGLSLALTNNASTNGVIAGAEILARDSPDGGTTDFDTQMHVLVPRIGRFNAGSESVAFIYASSEGDFAPDAILKVNPNGLATCKTAFDLRGWTYTGNNRILYAPNGTSLAWENTSNVLFDAFKVNTVNQVEIRPGGGTAKVKIKDGNGVDRLTVDNSKIEASIPIKLPSYTVATVPSASTMGAGAEIYVSDETGGAVPAFSDGTNWRRVTDRNTIS